MSIMKNLESSITNQVVEEKVNMIIDKIFFYEKSTPKELLYVLENISKDSLKYLSKRSREKTEIYYQDRVYMRALIEFTNYCKQGCNYCGIRAFNKNVDRYRLTKQEILDCCKEGYDLGYKTFVLQGGEDIHFDDETLVDIISSIKNKYPDCAITLSFGEQKKETYQKYFDAGCDRYLLRHESASRRLYEHLHPKSMSFDNRRNCLKSLKEIGFQVGAGFMVGSPTQTNEDLLEDLLFIHKLQPEMCGIGPYVCHSDTPFKGSTSGTVDQTRVMVALTRLLCPKTLLPAATAMGTVDPIGREKALKSGSNVVMPKVTPRSVRAKYELYEDMICVDDEASHCRNCIEGRINMSGFKVDLGRGDHVDYEVSKNG